jgi:two-component system, NtrC family, response regulator HydG
MMDPKILLVDDDMLLREVIGDFLISSGYEVAKASSAAEALSIFVPGEYKLALIDQNLKKDTGLKLMKDLQAKDKSLFCLIMTGYCSLNTVYTGVKEGSSDYIIKPFQMLELLNIIQKYI